jgi:glycosyltransferase involved in cell wall biosynthesis
MRLLFSIKAMNNPGGGAERVLADVANGLLARGHQIALLSFDLPGGKSFYALDPLIERIELGVGLTTSSATIMSTLRRILALRKNVCAYAPDVAIGFMHSMFIPLGLALIGTSIPMIASEHTVPEHYRSRPIEAVLLQLTPLLAKCITCVSEQVLCSYPLTLRRKMVAVVNPVISYSCRRADVSGCIKNRKVLLSVGSLEPHKNHAILIEAFAEIADHLPEWDLRIVGDGELRQELSLMITKFGLKERVSIAGVTKDIMEEYLSAQLFVQPSRYESFGLTAAEALAHGLPAVGFDDCSGINQLVHPGINGDLANGRGGRSRSLAKTLKALMENDDLRVRLSEQSGDIPHECRLERVLDHWEKIINKVKSPISC